MGHESCQMLRHRFPVVRLGTVSVAVEASSNGNKVKIGMQSGTCQDGAQIKIPAAVDEIAPYQKTPGWWAALLY